MLKMVKLEIRKINRCIVINSLVYLLLAYFVVVLSTNLYTILLAKILGFKAELFYYGINISVTNWNSEKNSLFSSLVILSV